MRRIVSANSHASGRGTRRCGAIAPLGGTTLLVLVTLVLATGQRDILPIRHAAADARWAEPATSRESREADTRRTEQTKPSAHKFLGTGALRSWVPAIALLPVASSAPLVCAAPTELIGVREALLNLPPPRA